VRLEVLRRRSELRVASELQAIAEPEAVAELEVVVEFQTVAVLILFLNLFCRLGGLFLSLSLSNVHFTMVCND
jgi:hypothetical protein